MNENARDMSLFVSGYHYISHPLSRGPPPDDARTPSLFFLSKWLLRSICAERLAYGHEPVSGVLHGNVKPSLAAVGAHQPMAPFSPPSPPSPAGVPRPSQRTNEQLQCSERIETTADEIASEPVKQTIQHISANQQGLICKKVFHYHTTPWK